MMKTSPIEKKPTTNLLFHFMCMLGILLGATLAVVKRQILPDRFFFDENRIILFVLNPQMIFRDGSYAGTTAIYTALGGYWLNKIEMSLITFGIFFALLQRFWPAKIASNSLGGALFYCMTLALGGIYVAGYTKEAILSILLLFFPKIEKQKNSLILWIILALLYAVFVRDYWLIVISLFVIQLILFRRVSPSRGFALFTPIVLLVISIGFRFVLDVNLHYFRTSVLEDLSVNPESAINNPFPGTSIPFDWLNGLWSIAVLLFPVPLVFLGLTQLPAAIYISTVWSKFLHTGLSRYSPHSVLELRIFSLGFAYLIVLSLFEPDYGSYIRHLTPVAPILLSIAFAKTVVSNTSTEISDLKGTK